MSNTKKSLLNENAVRRFMKLAEIDKLSDGFVTGLVQEATEEVNEMAEPFDGDPEGLDAGPSGLEMDMEGDDEAATEPTAASRTESGAPKTGAPGTGASGRVAGKGRAAAEKVARLVAPVLGWNDQHMSEEIEHYRSRVLAERDSQQQLDDDTADAARLGAPDVRLGVS